MCSVRNDTKFNQNLKVNGFMDFLNFICCLTFSFLLNVRHKFTLRFSIILPRVSPFHNGTLLPDQNHSQPLVLIAYYCVFNLEDTLTYNHCQEDFDTGTILYLYEPVNKTNHKL